MALDSEVVQVKASQNKSKNILQICHSRAATGLLGATCDANKRLDQQMLHTRNKQCKHPCATYFHFDHLRMRTSPQVAHHHKSHITTSHSVPNTEVVTNPAMIFAKHSSLLISAKDPNLPTDGEGLHRLHQAYTGCPRRRGTALILSWQISMFRQERLNDHLKPRKPYGRHTEFQQFPKQKNYGVPYILIRHNRHQQIPTNTNKYLYFDFESFCLESIG